MCLWTRAFCSELSVLFFLTHRAERRKPSSACVTAGLSPRYVQRSTALRQTTGATPTAEWRPCPGTRRPREREATRESRTLKAQTSTTKRRIPELATREAVMQPPPIPLFCTVSDEPTRISPWVLSSNGENAPQLFLKAVGVFYLCLVLSRHHSARMALPPERPRVASDR